MICPDCNGRGESIYYIETHRDENSVTVEQRKGVCRTCNGSGETPMTNADRIRAMSDEELAKVPAKFGYSCVFPQKACSESDTCEKCLLDWLKQPAEVPKEE